MEPLAAAGPAGMLLTEEGMGLVSEEGQTERRSTRPTQRSAVFLAGLTATVLLMAALAACATALGRSGGGGAAGAGASSLWAPTPPVQGAGCEIEVFARSGFGGPVLRLSTGTLDLPFAVGSLRVGGGCTAVLMGRSQDSSSTLWPCLLGPSTYDDSAVLGEACPILASVRTVGAQQGAIQEADTFKFRWDDKTLRLNDSAACARPIPPSTWTQDRRRRALEWFHYNFNVYVINTDRSPDRWAGMVRQFTKLELRNYIRVQGPDVESDAGKAPGTASSVLGHIGAWRAGAEADKQYAIVFEDDVILAGEFVEEMWDLVRARVPADWEIVSLSNGGEPYGQCVAPGMLRAPTLPAGYWCATTLGIADYGSGAHAFLYRRPVLPRVINLVRARSFAGRANNDTCSAVGNILYGAAGLFNLYVVFNHTAVTMKATAPSVLIEVGEVRRQLLQ